MSSQQPIVIGIVAELKLEVGYMKEKNIMARKTRYLYQYDLLATYTRCSVCSGFKELDEVAVYTRRSD